MTDNSSKIDPAHGKHTWCVIMAGGIGSRFWPMSRIARPKQFLDVLGLGRTLLQQTYDRFLSICPPQQILVVTSTNYRELVKRQLPAMKDEQILLEPSRRNTAPCVAYANQVISARDPKANIIVAPSDHLVMDQREFERIIQLALRQAASSDCLVTLGITPSRPDTGYGYIQFGEGSGNVDPGVKKVISFREKPDHATAQHFLESGDFLWNSGIFIWSAASIGNAFNKHLPDQTRLFGTSAPPPDTPEGAAYIAQVYAKCESISIDYGVLEKADNVHVVPGDFGWSDLGTWGSLFTHVPKDKDGNGVLGGQVKLLDARSNVVRVEDDRLVVLQGLEGYIVVSTPDVLLVCRQHDEQKIKQIVAEVTAESGERYV